MSAFRFPQPGERTNAAAVPVSASQLRSLLLMAARGIDAYYDLYGANELYEDAVARWRFTQATALGHETSELLRVMTTAGVPWPGNRG